MSRFPSLSYFSKSLLDFDLEIYDLLEKEMLKDVPPYFGKKQFLKKLLDHVISYKRKFNSPPGFVDPLIVRLGACISILGDKPRVREDVIREVREIASKYRSKELETLAQSRASQKLLEEPLEVGGALILAYIISHDEELMKSYTRITKFYSDIHGKKGEDLSYLFNLIPASITLQSVEYMKAKVERVHIIAPSSDSLIYNLDSSIISKAILGTLTFRPERNSGWITHRNYALSSLLSSSNFTKEQKLTMRVIFECAMCNNLELDERDDFAVPKYYSRLSESYSLLLDLISANFPNSASIMRKGKTKHLTTELKQLVRLCYGFYLGCSVGKGNEQSKELSTSNEVISSLKSMYDIKNDTFSEFCEGDKERCLQTASNWEEYMP